VNRTASLRRSTDETEVQVTADLDGTGTASIATGIGFWNHLLTSFAHHALVDIHLEASGDLEVDDHHTLEDTALVLGRAVAAALGDRSGIRRFGNAAVPMDEALATAALDAGGRPHAAIDLALTTDRVGTLTTQNLPHALDTFARAAGFTLHLTSRGSNDHHVAEAAFKALALALRDAVEIDPRRRGVPSTKGTTA
jgi:imidazoleglycerol-phosphate dehydratase